MSTSSDSRRAVTVADRVKAALAICVAGEIFVQTSKRPDSEAKLLRTRIAADALDKTRPDPCIFDRYHSKPEGQTDAQFLLANLADITALDSEDWPARKVSPHQWGEYTRAMRGLEVFMKKAYSGASFSKAERADVVGVLGFVAVQVEFVKDEAVKRLLTDDKVLESLRT
jgi:hypothetical protein